MREMKDSGIEWIGCIPSKWSLIDLKYLCDFKTGGTPSEKKGINDNYEGFPWITPTDILCNNELNKVKQYISKKAIQDNNYQLFNKNDILLVCIASIGKMTLLKESAYSNQQITALKNIHKLEVKYLFYFLNSMSDKIKFEASSNVVPIINIQYLKQIKCLYPDNLDQKSIVNYLDKKCSTIDSLFVDIQQQITSLEEYKKSIITEAVTKGLNPDVEMKDSRIEWIGEIPYDWKNSKIRYEVELRTEKGIYRKDDIFVGLENIEGNTGKYIETDTEYDEIEYDRFYKGDLLFNKLRPYLAKMLIADFDGFCTGELVVIKNTKIIKKYIYYYFFSYGFLETVNLSTYGTKMPRASWNFIQNLNIVYPDTIKKQYEIVQYLDEKCIEIDAIINSKKEQLLKLEDYKKSLIYEYVTGKKEVLE